MKNDRKLIQYKFTKVTLLTLFSLGLIMIFLPSMQTSFAQEEESEKIEIDIEDAVGTQEEESGVDSEKQVTMEEQIDLETEPGKEQTEMDTTEPVDNQILAPLKQISSGVSASDVVCKEGLELIIKASTGSPACVSSSTALALVERGWA